MLNIYCKKMEIFQIASWNFEREKIRCFMANPFISWIYLSTNFYYWSHLINVTNAFHEGKEVLLNFDFCFLYIYFYFYFHFNSFRNDESSIVFWEKQEWGAYHDWNNRRREKKGRAMSRIELNCCWPDI